MTKLSLPITYNGYDATIEKGNVPGTVSIWPVDYIAADAWRWHDGRKVRVAFAVNVLNVNAARAWPEHAEAIMAATTN